MQAPLQKESKCIVAQFNSFRVFYWILTRKEWESSNGWEIFNWDRKYCVFFEQFLLTKYCCVCLILLEWNLLHYFLQVFSFSDLCQLENSQQYLWLIRVIPLRVFHLLNELLVFLIKISEWTSYIFHNS